MESKRRMRLPSFREGFGSLVDADDDSVPPFAAPSNGPVDHRPPFVPLQCPIPTHALAIPPGRGPLTIEQPRKRSYSTSSSSSSQASSSQISSPLSSTLQSCPDSPPAKRPRDSSATSTPRSQRGFIILRPSSDGSALRVAATSAHSFGDALDALRHRTTPVESDAADGDCYAPAAPRTLFECPFVECGRKYTFMSNLRRHMRKSHHRHDH